MHEEIKQAGDDSAFLHISMLHPLQCLSTPGSGPDLALLQQVQALQAQCGASDHINAIMVALDALVKRALPDARKRIALISSFDFEVNAGHLMDR